jgi:pheromone shutdown protein TraB
MFLSRLNDCDVHILGVVRGLENEGDRVTESFRRTKPELIAVSLSKEDLDVIKDSPGKKEKATSTNFEEEVYIHVLGKFGDIIKPPPCYSAAVDLSKKNDVPCTPIDMNDEEFTDAFCKNVSTFELYRQSRGSKRLMRTKFKGSTPEEFVLEFDKSVNRLEGYRKLEKERERFMADKLLKLSKKWKSIMAVIELERLEGVKSHLANKQDLS